MTSLKNLFAVCIAISALGLTIAAHAGAFEAKRVRAMNCYTSVLVTQPNPDVLIGCGGGIVLCGTVQQYDNQLATGLTPPSCPIIDSRTCLGTESYFCCATIFSTGRIDQIFCKATPDGN